MAWISIWHIIVLMFSAELSQAARKMLLHCPDSSPPCIYTQVSSQNTCRGDNSSLSTDFKLPLSHITLITVTNIGIYGGSDPIFLGLSKIPSFEGHERWRTSHKISDISDKTGLLTVMIHVDNVHLEDEFMAHIEIDVTGQVLTTSDEIWFKVHNCSLQNTNQLNDEKRTENLHVNELHAFVQLLNLEFKNLIDAMNSKSFISSNMTDTNLLANYTASTSTSTILNIMILLILIINVISGGVLKTYEYVKYKRTLKKKSNIKDSHAICLETDILMQRKHETVNVDDKLGLVRSEEIEQVTLERYHRLQKQLDEINDSHKLLKSQQATQDERTMNRFDRLEKLVESMQENGNEKMQTLELSMKEREVEMERVREKPEQLIDESNDLPDLTRSQQLTGSMDTFKKEEERMMDMARLNQVLLNEKLDKIYTVIESMRMEKMSSDRTRRLIGSDIGINEWFLQDEAGISDICEDKLSCQDDESMFSSSRDEQVDLNDTGGPSRNSLW